MPKGQLCTEYTAPPLPRRRARRRGSGRGRKEQRTQRAVGLPGLARFLDEEALAVLFSLAEGDEPVAGPLILDLLDDPAGDGRAAAAGAARRGRRRPALRRRRSAARPHRSSARASSSCRSCRRPRRPACARRLPACPRRPPLGRPRRRRIEPAEAAGRDQRPAAHEAPRQRAAHRSTSASSLPAR